MAFPNAGIHPDIEKVIRRHQAFFDGKLNILVQCELPLRTMLDDVAKTSGASALEPEIPYDGLDWENDFVKYYKSRVHNALRLAEYRLSLALGDDSIPFYHPYFGIAIHHVFFSGKLLFGGGTSYMPEVIHSASEWEKLSYNLNDAWIQRLAEALDYCDAYGKGVLFASLRGGNGPLDMVNGVMGSAMFTELYDDEENMDKVISLCTDACGAYCHFQFGHSSEVLGGHIAPQAGGIWLPGTTFGHISVDASNLTGPRIFERVELPYLNRLAKQFDGFLVHTHMLGWRMFDKVAAMDGVRLLSPVNDPNVDSVASRLGELMEKANGVPILIPLEKDQIEDALPFIRGKRAIIQLRAETREDALRQIDVVRNGLAV